MSVDAFPKCSDERRTFLRAAASAAGLALVGCATARGREAERAPDDAAEAEVTPGEDLMQEHGVLERILLVYDEAARRIDAGESFDPATVTDAANLVREFIEAYHEQQEEKYVFPRMKAAGREVELVGVLLRQHERGRVVTGEIISMSKSGAGPRLAESLRAFQRMYRPHAAREETVLFPAFREVVGRSAYRELGEQFEETEHARFGEHGFERAVAEVHRLEEALGIADLASFTP